MISVRLLLYRYKYASCHKTWIRILLKRMKRAQKYDIVKGNFLG